MKKKVIISIDLGINGGISVIDMKGEIISFRVMPTMKEIVNKKEKEMLDKIAISILFSALFNDFSVKAIVMEKMVAMPNQFPQTAMSLGFASGFFHAIAALNYIACIEYRPAEWQKEMFKGINYTKDQTKQASIQVATKLYPGLNFKKSDRCKNYHDGITDSILIGLYHLRQKNKYEK